MGVGVLAVRVVGVGVLAVRVMVVGVLAAGELRGVPGPDASLAIAQQPHPGHLLQGDDLRPGPEVCNGPSEKRLQGLVDPDDQIRGLQRLRFGRAHLVGVGRRGAVDEQQRRTGLAHHAGDQGVDRLDAHHDFGRGVRAGRGVQRGERKERGAEPSFPDEARTAGRPAWRVPGYRPPGHLVVAIQGHLVVAVHGTSSGMSPVVPTGNGRSEVL